MKIIKKNGMIIVDGENSTIINAANLEKIISFEGFEEELGGFVNFSIIGGKFEINLKQENMNKELIQEKVIELISKRLGFDKVQIELNHTFYNDLGADSLDEIELLMDCEREFNIHIEDEEAEKTKTVQELIDFIYKKNK